MKFYKLCGTEHYRKMGNIKINKITEINAGKKIT